MIRTLWRGEKVTHTGPHYQTRQAKLYTRSDQPVPIYVSAMVGSSARFAGTYGDGLITVGGKQPAEYREILKNFAAGAADAEKNPDRVPRMIELGEGAIAARKSYWAGLFVPALFTERIYTPRMSEENGKAVGADIIRQSVCISADPEAHVKFARRYIDLGFNHLIFHSGGPDQRPFLENYGRTVLPRLRES